MIGEVIGNRYELQELVGSGGMSNVYRAYDRLLERPVALKLLHDRYSDDDEYVERFRREARAAARLSHPNIVTVIDRGNQDGRQYIVFEHVKGETLKELVRRVGPLPFDQAIELALQIGQALSFAHEHGLIHRDVKPQNVLLNGDGRAKVTDFGIARAREVDGFTQSGVVLGTSHYIAPEQATGEAVGAQTDVYSLGAVLFELLTGDVPFSGDNFVTVAMRHVRDPVPSVLEKRPETPVRLASAVERALEKDPARRFGSMQEFVDELKACRAQLARGGEDAATMIVRGPLAEDTAELPAQGARRSRRRWGWPLVILLAALAVAAIVVGVLAVAKPSAIGRGSHPRPPVHLRAVASYDPLGDGQERDDILGYASDGNRHTAWSTETYYDRVLTKPGVGIVFAAARPAKPATFTIWSGSPGFTAVIKAGKSQGGPFAPVSDSKTVGLHTTFDLNVASPRRYFLVWITKLHGEKALVNEVAAR